jgi:hypothetical protein
MNKIRITKYNPKNRNSEGHYLLNEWTCPSEIGKVFNGVKFEESEYFEIESKYIDAAINLIESMGLNSLRVVSLNTTYMNESFSDLDNKWLFENKFKEIELFEDKSLDIPDIKILLKMILRNFMGCSLEIDGEFGLFFGYDFYMYANISNMGKVPTKHIEALGLYVEDLSENDPDYSYEFSIDIGGKDEECIEDTVYLVDITRDKIRKGLGFSIEHPCNHHFQITSENCGMFSDQVNFDFERNEYFLSCDKNYC